MTPRERRRARLASTSSLLVSGPLLVAHAVRGMDLGAELLTVAMFGVIAGAAGLAAMARVGVR